MQCARQLCHLNLSWYPTFFTNRITQELMIFEKSFATFHVGSTSKFRVICHPCKLNKKHRFGGLKYVFHSTWRRACPMYVLHL